MNRQPFINSIISKLTHYFTEVKLRGNLGLFDIHKHSENFFRDLVNNLYDWDTINANLTDPNIEAIDLIDDKNKLVVQVSAQATRNKIESSLSKELIKRYTSYTFKFIALVEDATSLKKKSIKNPYGINFDPPTDIIDGKRLLNDINGLRSDKLESIHSFLLSELETPVDTAKIDSNLAAIIEILASTHLQEYDGLEVLNDFNIHKKIIFNDLINARKIIEENAYLTSRIDNIYSEYDKQGSNRSAAVLSSFQNIFISSSAIARGDALFIKIMEQVKNRVLQSNNCPTMGREELEYYVTVLTVDAFIRCKIFERPEE